MIKYNVIRKMHLFKYVFLIFLISCEQASVETGVDIAGNAELKKMSEQLTQMQEELRLVTKEVVSLQSKMDALANIALNNRPSNEPQGPTKVLLDGNGVRSDRLGDSNAKYAVVEFMDYQCPYCVRHAKQVFPRIKQKYIDSGQLQYVVRDYPLGFHSEGKPAAVVAECAAKQGKFWAMHQLLAQHSKELSADLYTSLAQKLELNIKQFDACRQDKAVAAHIEQDIAYGNEVGVNGTPRFYIGKLDGDAIVNVAAISGARSFSAFEQVIEQVMGSD